LNGPNVSLGSAPLDRRHELGVEQKSASCLVVSTRLVLESAWLVAIELSKPLVDESVLVSTVQ
jgi:hypothetical protein